MSGAGCSRGGGVRAVAGAVPTAAGGAKNSEGVAPGPPNSPPQAAETVVDKGQAELRVVRRAADERSLRGRRQFDRGDPDERDRDQHEPGGAEVREALARRSGRAQQVRERDPGKHQVGGQGLGIERQPDQRRGTEKRPQTPRLGGAQGASAGQYEQEDQGGIDVVAAGDRDERRNTASVAALIKPAGQPKRRFTIR